MGEIGKVAVVSCIISVCSFQAFAQPLPPPPPAPNTALDTFVVLVIVCSAMFASRKLSRDKSSLIR